MYFAVIRALSLRYGPLCFSVAVNNTKYFSFFFKSGFQTLQR